MLINTNIQIIRGVTHTLHNIYREEMGRKKKIQIEVPTTNGTTVSNDTVIKGKYDLDPAVYANYK